MREKSRKYDNKFFAIYYNLRPDLDMLEALPDIDAAIQLSHSESDRAQPYRGLSEGRKKA